MSILSFQSAVTLGYVGNAAAVFALERVGRTVWPVATVSFSNHPGRGGYRGRVAASEEIAEIVEGFAAIGAMAGCEAVLSGYLGSAENGGAVLTAVEQVKAANPRAVYCCDPVMGDRDTGLYVDDGIVRFLRDRAAPVADVLMPNHFELEVLFERRLAKLDDVIDAADQFRRRGARVVTVTSVIVSDIAAGEIGNLVVAAEGVWVVVTPRLDLRAKGSGDLLAALFMHEYIGGHGAEAALRRAVSAVYAVVEATAAANAVELALIEAQGALITPPRRFEARRLR